MKIHRSKVVNSTLLWLGMVQCEMGRHLFWVNVLGIDDQYVWTMFQCCFVFSFSQSQFLGIFVWKQLVMAGESSDFYVSGIA